MVDKLTDNRRWNLYSHKPKASVFVGLNFFFLILNVNCIL